MENLLKLKNEMEYVLFQKIIPFWLQNSIDQTYGGYLTGFDGNGQLNSDENKYIVTQTRMIWGFSYLSDIVPEDQKPRLLAAARQGVDFLLGHMWDSQYGGFVWKTDRQGNVLDSGKVIYGQSFAIYALSQYYINSGDQRGLEYAKKLFDLLQVYAVDTLNGGYYENLESGWSVSPGGKYAGNRKSLDIHMHLMEAFTTLYAAGKEEIHRRKLQETISIILRHMINVERGYGYNQFDLEFNRIPAINIHRTWNADRIAGEALQEPADTTSYGHNVEFSWLLDAAITETGESIERYLPIIKKLLDHSLSYGYDYKYGGVYRDGIATEPAAVKDKEWWQNFESLVGYANGYLRFKDEKYYEALEGTWNFIRNYFMNMDAGESMQMLSRKGETIVPDIGNPWKGIYHTGRALAETVTRIDKML